MLGPFYMTVKTINYMAKCRHECMRATVQFVPKAEILYMNHGPDMLSFQYDSYSSPAAYLIFLHHTSSRLHLSNILKLHRLAARQSPDSHLASYCPGAPASSTQSPAQSSTSHHFPSAFTPTPIRHNGHNGTLAQLQIHVCTSRHTPC